MEKRQRAGIRKSPNQDFFHSLIVEQRGATEELKALTKELQTLLDDLLTARPELMYRELMVEPDLTETRVRQPETPPEEMSRPQWKREAERNVLKSAELIRESGRIRQRSKGMRAALRGAAPQPIAGNHGKDGRHATNGRSATNGKNATNGKKGHNGLSRREFEVLHLIVDGKTSKEVAAELGISFKTAVTHRASIMSKLDVHEIASVVREAIHRGLV